MIVPPCPFCLIRDGELPARFASDPVSGKPMDGKRSMATMTFRPLHPHSPGHLLVVPTLHVQDAAESPSVAAYTMEDAAEYVATIGGDWNILTSIGPRATQTVMHLHVHLVERGANDRLPKNWPWVKRR